MLSHFPPEDLEMVYTHRAINVLLTKQSELLHTIVDEGILSDQNAKYFYDMIESERNQFGAKRKQQTRGMLLANIQRKMQEDEDVAFRDSMTGMISMNELKKHAVERALNASLDPTTNRISEMTEQSYAATKPSLLSQRESQSLSASTSSSFPPIPSNRVRKEAPNEEEEEEDRSCFMSNNSTISNEFRPNALRSGGDGRRLHGSFVFNAVLVDAQQNSTFNPLRRGSEVSSSSGVGGGNSRVPSTAPSSSMNTLLPPPAVVSNEGEQREKQILIKWNN